MRRGLKFGIAAAAAMAMGGQAYAAPTVFFSTDSESPGSITVPSLELEPGETTSLYIWIALAEEEDFGQSGGSSLSIFASDSSVATAASSEVQNPIYDRFGLGGDGELVRRWNEPVGHGDLNVDSYLVQDINTIAAIPGDPEADAGVEGIRGMRVEDIDPSVAIFFPDPMVDVDTMSFLHAVLEIEGGAVGTTDLYFEVGGNRNNTSGDFISPNFGADNVDVGSTVGSRGQNADATITVVPEPGSLALLGIGGLMLLRRRRA